MRTALHFVLPLLLATTVFTAPAFAQSKKELAAQDAVLAQRISNLESRMLTGDPAAERLMQRMDGLEASMRNLTGEVESLRFERDNLRSEVEALVEDLRAMQALSDRMKIHLDAVDLVSAERQQAEALTAPRVYGDGGGGGAISSPAPQPGPTYESGGNISSVPSAPTYKEVTIPVQEQFNDIAQLPETGKQKMREGDFLGAQSAFKQYLDFNPDAADAGEISFWLGETYYVRGGYTDAADSFIASMRKDPNGVKGPDAMVRLAATLRQLGKTAEACQTLASFPSQYPNASSAQRDKARVESARTGC